MSTSRATSQAAGFEQAVKAYFDAAIKLAEAGMAKRSLETQRSKILTSHRGMSDMLAILDEQDSDYVMSKGIALFYTGWSTDVWQNRANHPLYPFMDEQKHATKGKIDQWQLACLENKHGALLNDMQSPDWGRDPGSGRPYLVDMATGQIICDGQISGIEKKHSAALAQADIEIRIHTFTEALAFPWRDESMRQVWARGYRGYLRDISTLADKALAEFDAAEDRRRTPEVVNETKPRRA